MPDENRPGTYGLGSGRAENFALEEGHPLPPLPEVRIWWSGVLKMLGGVVVLVIVGRVLGVLAAQVLVVGTLLGLAGSVLLDRRRRRLPNGDAAWGYAGGEYGAADFDCGGIGGDAGGGD